MNTLLPIWLSLGLSLTSASFGFGQDYGPGGRPSKQPPYEWRTSKFRYLIYYNAIKEGSHLDRRREIHVLLDRPAFSVETLKELFQVISKRFPRPQWLQVDVYTDLIDVPTPEESDVPGMSGMGEDPHRGKSPRAFLERTETKSLVGYTPEPPPYINMKTVVLQSK